MRLDGGVANAIPSDLVGAEVSLSLMGHEQGQIDREDSPQQIVRDALNRETVKTPGRMRATPQPTCLPR